MIAFRTYLIKYFAVLIEYSLSDIAYYCKATHRLNAFIENMFCWCFIEYLFEFKKYVNLIIRYQDYILIK